MIKKVFIPIIILLFNYTYSQQNLVPNGSFEDTLHCPNNATQTDFALKWFDPTKVSSDYYNACSMVVSVPNNIAGFQNAFHGKAYMGLANFDKNTANYREYIAVKLSKTLETNRTYCFSLRASLADSVTYACNNISLGFFYDTSQFIDLTFSPNKILNPNSFHNLTKNIVIDKLNWTLLSTSFKALGNENYLVIGNFNNDANTDTLKLHNGNVNDLAGYEVAYYYLDSITLKECIDLQKQINQFEFNLITPNGDGYNDSFDFSNYDVSEFSFQVFNRWGNLVFKTNDKRLKWYGQNNDYKPLPNGTYYYLINAIDENNKLISIHTFVQILY